MKEKYKIVGTNIGKGENSLVGDGEIVELTPEEYKAKLVELKPAPTYKELRTKDYGPTQEQLEYIVENGLEAFITKQKAVKVKYPKES